MNCDLSLLCSNAGFTAGAIRKAKRKNIGLIGVLRENDNRVKYEIVDDVYKRRLEMKTFDVAYHFPKGCLTLPAGPEILYKAKPVQNWMAIRTLPILAANLVVSGKLRAEYTFKRPIRVRHAITSERSLLEGCSIAFSFTGSWVLFEDCRISASSGLYDWLKKAIRVGPGRSFAVVWNGVTFGTGGKTIYEPPKDLFPDWPYNSFDGVALHKIIDVGRFDLPPAEQIPQLEPLIIEEDLELRCRDLPECHFYPT